MYRFGFTVILIQQAKQMVVIATRMFVYCLVIMAGTEIHAQSEGTQPTAEQFLVLTNGNLLQGVVEKKTDEVIIRTSQGSRLVLDPDSVAFVCDSVEEAYWGKLARIKARDIEGQIELFHWCLQQNKFKHAQNQIDILQLSRIKATRLNYLNRHLKIASSESNPPQVVEPIPIPPSQEKRSLQQNAIASRSRFSPGNSFETLDPVFKPLPAMTDQLAKDDFTKPGRIFKSIRSPVEGKSSEVIQVGYTEPVESESPRAESASARLSGVKNPPATLKELDDLCRAMPKGALGEFRRKIEKVFVIRCSDCHSVEAEVMPLMHAGRLQPATRRMSQRNLHSILQFVDKADPMASPLMVAASTAHGGGEVALIKSGTIQYENLQNWLVMISNDPGQTIIPAEPKRIDESEIRKRDMKPIKSSAANANPKSNAERHTSTTGDVSDISKEPDFTPRDDFDPEIFNRRLRKK